MERLVYDGPQQILAGFAHYLAPEPSPSEQLMLPYVAHCFHTLDDLKKADEAAFGIALQNTLSTALGVLASSSMDDLLEREYGGPFHIRVVQLHYH